MTCPNEPREGLQLKHVNIPGVWHLAVSSVGKKVLNSLSYTSLLTSHAGTPPGAAAARNFMPAS